ncbi:MAG: GlxA family transcriptional regulator [Pseudomonadota bacterium]
MDISQVGTRPFKVGILPIDGFALMSYGCCVEPLRAANLLARRTLFDIVHLGFDPVVQSSGAATVEPCIHPSQKPNLDMLLVIAGGDPLRFENAAFFHWLRQAARSSLTLGGVSGGPVILAKAGVMDGYRMTVHWEHAAELAEMHPELTVEKRLYVFDRDRVTCGGGTAPLDLMHDLIAQQHGGAFARTVSDWFLHTEVRAAAAPQRSGLIERLGNHPGHVLDAIATMENHVGDRLSLAQLALTSGVTRRHLNRLFRSSFGVSTMAYYRGLRLDLADKLLSTSTMSIANIAAATGFATAGHFSSAYRSARGRAPRDVRAGGTERSQAS